MYHVSTYGVDERIKIVERQNVTRLVINGVYHRPGHGDEFAHTEKRRKKKAAQNQFTDTMIHEPRRYGCIIYYNHIVKMSPWGREEMST